MICCITGHRPERFPFKRNEDTKAFVAYQERLLNVVQNLIDDGYNHFISGMAEGADIDFVYAVLKLRTEETITLEAALPCPYSTKKTTDKSRLLNIIDKITIVSDHYYKGCMQKRNKYMVDQSDLVIAVWDGKTVGGTWNTIKYAKSKEKQVIYIMLCDISTTNY